MDIRITAKIKHAQYLLKALHEDIGAYGINPYDNRVQMPPETFLSYFPEHEVVSLDSEECPFACYADYESVRFLCLLTVDEARQFPDISELASSQEVRSA
mgnify:CR=1 FL=1